MPPRAGGEARVPQRPARRASPLLRARRRTLPGGSAYLAAVPAEKEAEGRRREGAWQAARAITGGVGAPRLAATSLPHQRPPDAIATLLARVGPQAVAAPGSRPRPPEPKGQISFHNKVSWSPATPLEAKAGRAARLGRERGPPGAVRWEAREGEGGRRRARRLDLLGSQLQRRGAEEPGSSKTKPKMGNGEAPRQEGFCAGV